MPLFFLPRTIFLKADGIFKQQDSKDIQLPLQGKKQKIGDNSLFIIQTSDRGNW